MNKILTAAVAALAVALAAPSPAAAWQPGTPGSPGVAVEIKAPCPQKYYDADGREIATGGCYYKGATPAEDRIYYSDLHALWHERGHAFDAWRLTEADRTWISARFFRGIPWWVTLTRASTSAGEKFAEAYAFIREPKPKALIRAARSGGYYGTQGAYGYVPYTAKHRALRNAVAVLDLIR